MNIIKLPIVLFVFYTFTLTGLKAQRSQNGDGNRPAPIGVIKGSIVEKSSRQPVEYANIMLYRVKDSSFITGTITDAKGAFVLENLYFGNYYLKINFIGFKPQYHNGIKINPNNPIAQLPAIELESNATTLDAVEITADKPLVQFNLDKKVINVEQNLVSAGGSAIDVLQNTPSVTVDVEGNVSLRGNSNVTVLINGKPSGLSNSAILEQIPAGSIENIELITNPSAKYDPDGISGIINVVLKKERKPGLNGIVSANIGWGDKYNANAELNYRIKKFNFFGGIDFRKGNRNGGGFSIRESLYNDTILKLLQESDVKRNGLFYNGKLGFDYYLNDKNTLTFTGTYRNGLRKGTSANLSTEYYFGEKITGPYQNYESEEDPANNYDIMINYKKYFENKNKNLTIDMSYNSAIENEEEESMQEVPVNSMFYSSLSQTAPHQIKISDESRNRFMAQTDYSHPFANNTKMELGAKAQLMTIDADFNAFEIDNVLQTRSFDSLQSNHFVYDEQIYSIYGTYGGSLKWFDFQTGLRLEQAYNTSKQLTQVKNYYKDYFSFFPSVHLSKKLPLKQEVMLSYSRRINRPRIHSLNPFRDYSNPLLVRYGNPYLNPEYINSYEIGYSKMFKKINFNSSLFYREIQDMITYYRVLEANNVIGMTAKNLNSGQSYGVEAIVSTSFYKWWKSNTTFSYFRTVLNDDSEGNDYTTSNYTWTAKTNQIFNIGKGSSFQVSGNYRAPMVLLQGKTLATYFVDIGARTDLIRNKLTLNMRASDIFKTMKWRMITESDGVKVQGERFFESRTVFIGLSYKINDYKRQQRRQQDNGNDIDFNDME